MAARGEGAVLARIRAAVATEVDAVGLRPVARQVGMDPRGITKFLDGAHPRAQTRQKLERWYVQRVASGGGAAHPSAALSALRVLVQGLAPADREAAIQATAECLAEVYRRSEVPLPDWLEALQRG
jgi:hypothetical protein